MIKCYKNFNQIITLAGAHKKDGRHLKPVDLSIIENASIIFDQHKILWIGNTTDIPSEYQNCETKDFTGHILTPEMVDSHTHLVFAGNRAFEYTMRLNGADYSDIAKAGGGILATMEKTMNASEKELYQTACERIEHIHSLGIGTIEIKSGYGLSYESEKKISKVIAKLKQHFKHKVQILNTYLAAHAVPKNFNSSKDYLEKIVIPLMSELAQEGIIDFVDIFHEENYFTTEDAILLFEKAKSLKLKIKIHADEFNDNSGAELAVKYHACSADHLLATSDAGIKALANSSTVATLLPGTAFFLGKPLANARKFLDAGCKLAIASDYNPGSCHIDNLLFIANMSAKSLQLNSAELWSAICLNSAHALDLKDQGALIAGLKPRFSLFKCETIDEVNYSWGKNFSVKA